LFTLLDGEPEVAIALEPGNPSQANQASPSRANRDGQDLFLDTCQFCHGRTGEGGHDGVPLEGLAAFETNYVADIIRDGRNNMPAFGAMFSAGQIRTLAEYVRSLNPDIPNRN
jgi:mono/diheme cytochrome c family protein